MNNPVDISIRQAERLQYELFKLRRAAKLLKRKEDAAIRDAPATINKIDYDTKLDLYRQRSKDLAAKAQGIERYLYEIFGTDLIGSLALAFDPWERFTFTRDSYSLANRTRIILGIQTHLRSVVYSQVTQSWGYIPDVGTAYAFDYLYTGPSSSVGTHGTVGLSSQPAIMGFIKDSTYRTRGRGVKFGEFELFSPSFTSPGTSFSDPVLDNEQKLTTGKGLQMTKTLRHDVLSLRGSALLISATDVINMATTERARALNSMSSHALGMLDKCLPSSRVFNAAYQLGELRDLPQAIEGTLKAWRDASNLIGVSVWKDLLLSPRKWSAKIADVFRDLCSFGNYLESDKALADAYLTFKFGWQSIYQAVLKLLPSPEKISKQVNRLIGSFDKDISLRTGFKFVEPIDSFPGMSGELLPFESLDQASLSVRQTGFRNVELRCVVNVAIKFPYVDIPRLRTKLLLEKLGLTPTPGDIYDLIPWTWLLDWYSGIGDYIHLMDTVRGDPTLVNHAFMTYKAVSQVNGQLSTKISGSKDRVVEGVHSGPTTVVNHHTRSGVFVLKYQLRKSISEIAKVGTYLDPLSENQVTILGALATKFGGTSKGRKP